MKTKEMYVHLKGMKFYAFHGVLPQENKVGAEYTLDLSLKTDFAGAAESDELEGTVSYASVYDAVKAEMGVPSKLLEHVIFRIAQRLFHDFTAVQEIRIGLCKQNPPMGADGKSIGVEAVYER